MLSEPEAEDSLSNYTMYSQISRISKVPSKSPLAHNQDIKPQYDAKSCKLTETTADQNRRFLTLQQRVRKQTYQTVYRTGIAADAQNFDKNRTVRMETNANAIFNK